MPPVLRSCLVFVWYYLNQDREVGEWRAVRGRYESADIATARAHIAELKAKGFNHIALSWWGTRSGAGNEWYEHIQVATLLYVQACQEAGITWSILWESTTPGTTAADLAQIEAFSKMGGAVKGPDGRALVRVFNRIYDTWPLDFGSAVHQELTSKYYVVYDKCPDVSQLPRGTGYTLYGTGVMSTTDRRARYQAVVDNGKITLHAYVSSGFDNRGIYSPATSFSCTDPLAHTGNYPPGHQFAVGWTQWPRNEAGYINGHSLPWLWFQLQDALRYGPWEILYVWNERGEHNMLEPTLTTIGNGCPDGYGFGTLFLDEAAKMLAWIDSPARLGLQSFAGQDAALYTAAAARIDLRNSVARTWSRFVALPIQAQLDAVLARQAHGARTQLVLTGTPEGAPSNITLPPASTSAWITAAGDAVAAFLGAGVILDTVCVWDRPDVAAGWSGTAQAFYDFYAAAVPALQQRFPLLRIGGPSVSQPDGSTFEWWEGLFQACRGFGVRPGYFGFQMDRGFATDLERFQIGPRLRELYSQITGRPSAEAGAIPVTLDAWAYRLPDGSVVAENSDHRAAANLLATILSLGRAGFSAHSYFDFQDGAFSSADYDHRSSGVFTLNDGPKATWSALKLLSAVLAFGDPYPVRRLLESWSTAIYCAKSASGHRRILVANSPRFDTESALRYLQFHGVDVTYYAGLLGAVKAFMQGEMTYAQTGFPPEHEQAWNGARDLWNDYRAAAEGAIDVRLQLDVRVGAVQDVVAIDATRGNPSYWYEQTGSSYRQTFISYKNGTGATLADVLDHPQAGAEALTDTSGIKFDDQRLTITMQPHTVLALTVVPG